MVLSRRVYQQVFSALLSQIVWLQLLCIVLYPIFFNQLNADNDTANIITYTAGLLMLSYLIIRNFAFNDAKYKTKLLFSILPVTHGTIIGARGVIVYLFCLAATPLLIFFSKILHIIKPEMFAVVPFHIIPYGLLLAAVFLPIEFLIFCFFDTQKADIIAALAIFPYMGLTFIFCKYLMNSLPGIIVPVLAVITNVICFMICQRLYRNKQI